MAPSHGSEHGPTFVVKATDPIAFEHNVRLSWKSSFKEEPRSSSIICRTSTVKKKKRHQFKSNLSQIYISHLSYLSHSPLYL